MGLDIHLGLDTWLGLEKFGLSTEQLGLDIDLGLDKFGLEQAKKKDRERDTEAPLPVGS